MRKVIRHMHDGQRSEPIHIVAPDRLVMLRDRACHCLRQTPQIEEIRTDVTVRRFQNLPFNFPNRLAMRLRIFEDFAVALREIFGEHQLADVVQQSRDERLLRQRKRSVFCFSNNPRQVRRLSRMIPNPFNKTRAELSGTKLLTHPDHQNQVANRFNAQKSDRLMNARDFSPQTEKRGVGQLQNLCAHRGVADDDFRHISQVHARVRQGLHQFAIDRRNAGQPLQGANHLHHLQRQSRLPEQDQLANLFDENLGVGRLGNELMGRVDRFEDQFLIRLRRKNNARGGGMPPHHLLQQFRPVHARHLQVGDNRVKPNLLHAFQRFRAARDKLHVPLVAHWLKNTLQNLQRKWFIINEYYAPPVQGCFANGESGHTQVLNLHRHNRQEA